MRPLLCGLILLHFLSITGYAENPWILKKNDEEIKVYYQDREDGYRAFRGLTLIRSSLNGLVALFRDLNAMPEWVDRTVSAERLEKVSDTEFYIYIVNQMPWPFKNRDVVIHSRLEQDPENLTVTIRGADDKNHPSPKGDYVRMRKVESYWSFKPLEDGHVEVTFQGYGDAGGSMSSDVMRWFIDRALWESPFNTLKGLRAVIHQDKYQHQTFAFIQEGASFP